MQADVIETLQCHSMLIVISPGFGSSYMVSFSPLERMRHGVIHCLNGLPELGIALCGDAKPHELPVHFDLCKKGSSGRLVIAGSHRRQSSRKAEPSKSRSAYCWHKLTSAKPLVKIGTHAFVREQHAICLAQYFCCNLGCGHPSDCVRGQSWTHLASKQPSSPTHQEG